jgi:hypothetical protein
MAQQKFSPFIGDSTDLEIALEWQGAAFLPGSEWLLIFTAKFNANDPDSSAPIQKASGAGIVVSGSTATVSLVPQDTSDLADGCNLIFDIQAQSTVTQKIRTVASGEIYMIRDITIRTETSVPVVTTEPPLPFARTAQEIHSAEEKADLVDNDELGIADSEDDFVIKKLTWGNILSSIQSHFDAIYSEVGHTHLFSEISGKPTTVAGYGITDAITDSDVSNSGGVEKIHRSDQYGNIRLGGIVNQSVSVAGETAFNGEYSVIFGDQKGVLWAAADAADGSSIANFNAKGIGKLYASIRYWRNHDAGQGEWNFDSNGRVCWYWSGGMQYGNAAGGSHYIYLHSGGSTALNTATESVPIMFNTTTWNGSTSVMNRMVVQAAPLDLSGTNPGLHVYKNGVADSGQQDMAATAAVPIATIATEGIWSAGTAPAFSTLTDGATVTVMCSKFKTVQSAKVTLGGNRTLAISGILPGMRGVLYVQQDATGSRTLMLPNGSATTASWALSTAPYTVDRLTWEYDGTYYYWSMDKGITLPMDVDAAAFITAASITDDAQETAVNNLVLSLKGAGLWSKFYAIYPFVGGTSTAHSKDLKGAYNGTFGGAVTHDANGITGDATSGYFNTLFDFAAVGALNSASCYFYCRTDTPTDGRYFYGATGTGPSRVGMGRTGANVYGAYINTNDLSMILAASSDFSRHFAHNRSASTAQEIYVGSNRYNNATASTQACDRDIAILARNSSGTFDNFTNANIAFGGFGQSLTESEWTAFRGIVDTFQTALGRANP